MKCPNCEHLENKVVDSRLNSNGQVVRRRRECDKCKHRYTTYERLEYIVPAVIKKDGKRETFDREKLLKGVRVACNKRPVTAEAMEGLVDAVQRELTKSGERELPSSLIGEKVMARLREIDDVAYVRFSSVYKSFRDVEEFLAELGTLVKPEGK